MNNKFVLLIAILCHEANRAWCALLGDKSQPAWKYAPEWQKESAIKGVEFHLANPESTPSDSHESWLKEKEADGWKYGPVKDPAKKEHPCFVPYDDLPLDQKMKDFLFLNTVRAVEAAGEKYGGQAMVDMLAKIFPDQVLNDQLTFGQKAAGVSFNPSKDVNVDIVKDAFAEIIDFANNFRNGTENGDQKRYASTAITQAEIAQMELVKAVTWPHK